jgi:hypothetical protein
MTFVRGAVGMQSRGFSVKNVNAALRGKGEREHGKSRALYVSGETNPLCRKQERLQGVGLARQGYLLKTPKKEGGSKNSWNYHASEVHYFSLLCSAHCSPFG